MVYCMKCGTVNPDESVYCSKCGAHLRLPDDRHLVRDPNIKPIESFAGTADGAEPARLNEEVKTPPRPQEYKVRHYPDLARRGDWSRGLKIATIALAGIMLIGAFYVIGPIIGGSISSNGVVLHDGDYLKYSITDENAGSTSYGNMTITFSEVTNSSYSEVIKTEINGDTSSRAQVEDWNGHDFNISESGRYGFSAPTVSETSLMSTHYGNKQLTHYSQIQNSPIQNLLSYEWWEDASHVPYKIRLTYNMGDIITGELVETNMIS